MNDSKILDDFYFDAKGVKSLEDIKNRLRIGGIKDFYEHKNGSIIVKKSEKVKISIRIENEQIKTKALFPTIGNSVQFLSSPILLVISFYLPIPFPSQFIIAIGGGQIISYFWHLPKIKKLESQVENLLQ